MPGVERAAVFSFGRVAENSNAPGRQFFSCDGARIQWHRSFGEFDRRARQFSLLEGALPLSELEGRLCRKLPRLGSLRDGICRLSIRGRWFGSGRLLVEALRIVPAPVLFHLLVRPRKPAGASLRRQR